MAGGDLSVAEYQRLAPVLDRAREFCGLTSDAEPRCVYVSGMGPADGPHVTWGHVTLRDPGALFELMSLGNDVARSLWDTGNLLVYVDLDYRDAAFPGRAYLQPAECFFKLEPAYRALCAALDALGMPMLELVTGAGYALVGRVALDGSATERLAALAPADPAWLATHSRRRPPWARATIDARGARAFHGLGLVLERLAHRVLRAAAPHMEVPLVMNNTDVGRSGSGRESVSIDLTHMGDPLDARHLRPAFCAYQKHRLRRDLFGPAAARMPPLAVVPRARRPLLELLDGARSLPRAAAEAEVRSGRIPDVEPGLHALLDEYEASSLAAWHREYDAMRPHTPAERSAAVERLDPASLPPCVAECLAYPNDLLLKPSFVQMLVRVLVARGWHARHVAALVEHHYTRPGIWGDHWTRIDPATRAVVDARVFGALIAMGLDAGIDLNCVSTQERGMCPGTGCRFDLRHDRDRMREQAGR